MNNQEIWKQEIIDDIKFLEQYKFISKQSIFHKTGFYPIYELIVERHLNDELFIDILYNFTVEGNYKNNIFTIEKITLHEHDIQLFFNDEDITLAQLNRLLGKNLHESVFISTFHSCNLEKIIDSIKSKVINNINVIDEQLEIVAYRSIGQDELSNLLDGHLITGRYSLKKERQSTGYADNILCFFRDKIIWKDKNHQFLIKVRFMPHQIIQGGIGTYYVPKSFETSKIWSGRRGNTEVFLNEIYVTSYALSNVSSIEILDDAIDDELKILLEEKFNVKL